MHTLPCVCPPREESLFPSVLSKSYNQIPLAFKVWFSRNSSSCCRTHSLGSLTWGSETSLQWVDFCCIMFSSLWVTHAAVMGFDFTVIAPLLLSQCGFSFVFGCGVFFLVSSSVFLSMTVQQLVVIPVFSQEGMTARPYILFFQCPYSLNFFFPKVGGRRYNFLWHASLAFLSSALHQVLNCYSLEIYMERRNRTEDYYSQ